MHGRQVGVIGLYEPTSMRNIDQVLARLPPDLKKFASGLDYHPLQLQLDEPETPTSGPGGKDVNEATEETAKMGVGADEEAVQQGSSPPLKISVSSPAGSHRSDEAYFAPAGQVATQTVSWVLRAAGLRM